MSYEDAKRAGLVFVGEWGYGDKIRGAGGIFCRPENAADVRAAYDCIKDGDLGPNVLDYVFDAGGVFVRDTEED